MKCGSEHSRGQSDRVQQGPVSDYTYPLVLLSDVPAPPPDDELSRLQAAFSTSFKQHIFINSVDFASSSSNPLPPYLQLALACLSAVTSHLANASAFDDDNGALQEGCPARLFVAGVNLWSVMLEVDNREARLLEAVVAVRLDRSARCRLA